MLESDSKAAPAFFVVRDGNAPIVRFYDLIGDRQSKAKMVFPASGFFYPVKAVENLLLIFVGYANTGVLNLYSEAFPRPGKRKCDLAVFWRIADGIVKENGNNLTDPFWVNSA